MRPYGRFSRGREGKAPRVPADFFAFVRLASEIEDFGFADQSRPGTYDQSIRKCEEDIVEEAEKLIAL